MVLLNVRWEQVGMGMGRVGLSGWTGLNPTHLVCRLGSGLDILEPDPLGILLSHSHARPLMGFTVVIPSPPNGNHGVGGPGLLVS